MYAINVVVIPLRRIHRFNGDGRRRRVIAGQATDVIRNIAPRRHFTTRQRYLLPAGLAGVRDGPVVKPHRPSGNRMYLAVIVGIVQSGKLVDTRQTIKRTSPGGGISQCIGMHHAGPGFIHFILGSGRPHLYRQFREFKREIIHGYDVHHMPPHMGFWRIRACRNGKLHATRDRRVQQ